MKLMLSILLVMLESLMRNLKPQSICRYNSYYRAKGHLFQCLDGLDLTMKK